MHNVGGTITRPDNPASSHLIKELLVWEAFMHIQNELIRWNGFHSSALKPKVWLTLRGRGRSSPTWIPPSFLLSTHLRDAQAAEEAGSPFKPSLAPLDSKAPAFSWQSRELWIAAVSLHEYPWNRPVQPMFFPPNPTRHSFQTTPCWLVPLRIDPLYLARTFITLSIQYYCME